MGKLRSGPHLLEAFRAGVHREGEPVPTQARFQARRAAEAPPPVREVSLGEPPCFVISVSATVLAALVVVGVVLLVGAFLLGRNSVGRSQAEVKGAAEQEGTREAPATEAERRASFPAAVPGQPAPGEAAGSQPAVFAVQVATYGPGKSSVAEDVATFLRSRSFSDVEVRQVDNQYRVLVGRFPAADDPLAGRLLQAVKQQRYGNSDFRSAYIVRVP